MEEDMDLSDLSIKQNWPTNQISKLLLDDSMFFMTPFWGHKQTHVVHVGRSIFTKFDVI